MKTETITITTTKTLQEISTILRKSATKLRANIATVDHSPFGYVNHKKGNMRIALSGSNYILGRQGNWGAQIVVIDQGLDRDVELTAVGGELNDELSKGSDDKAYFELKDSKKRVDAIAKMITA